MKNYKQGFIVPLLILIIAVLVIGGGIYFYSQNKSQQAPQQSLTKNQTSQVSTNPDDNVIPDPSKPSSFSVISPKKGDVLVAGQTYAINWTSVNVGNQPIFISLRTPDNQVVKEFASGVTNSGNYSWTVGSSIQTGNYNISVNTSDNLDKNGANVAWGKSDAFSIISNSTSDHNLKMYTNTKYGFQLSYPAKFAAAEEYPNHGQQECRQTDIGKGTTMNFVNAAIIPDLLQINVVCQTLQYPQASTLETDLSATSVTSNNQYKTVNIAGKQSNEIEFVTSTGYLWKIAQIPLNNSHYVEIGYTFGNASRLNGLIELSDTEWNSILSSFTITR